jgi:hypothetical protein
MKRIAWMMSSALVMALGAGPVHGATSPASAPPPAAAPSLVETWVRASGPVTGDQPPRQAVATLNLDALPLVEVERVDIQYEGLRAFRGIAVKTVIDRLAPDASLDLAILHFANGMAIPLPFRDAAVMKRLDPFIARAMETYRKGPIKTDFFLDVPKKGAMADARPIVFHGNKVVVSERWHPAVAPGAQPAFSPWAHADTLVAIELAASGPYYRQFDVGGGLPVQRGLAVFEETCQFCHGARKVGAKFGWDFVDPTPIYTYQKASRNLFYHVAYKPLDAAQKGLMMPALKFMTETDAAALWQWMKAVATNPMPPYAAPALTAKAPPASGKPSASPAAGALVPAASKK